ncbi:hypothetical protein WOLCODRAFT_162483 [Wolfiporia cocos MD-104 SS10]|uniref:WW domain-containing protein n=1 Tax=Wolfiporia cocos (strain MD-104) TaxID=742152 RepID=A0A2H3JFP3_WOLCO|nr:hypothetical protein WOLCODRAFT_162483 [Wolfiporia cocos MD-104 SS10]
MSSRSLMPAENPSTAAVAPPAPVYSPSQRTTLSADERLEPLRRSVTNEPATPIATRIRSFRDRFKTHVGSLALDVGAETSDTVPSPRGLRQRLRTWIPHSPANDIEMAAMHDTQAANTADPASPLPAPLTPAEFEAKFASTNWAAMFMPSPSKEAPPPKNGERRGHAERSRARTETKRMPALSKQARLARAARALGGSPVTDLGDGWTKYINLDGQPYYHESFFDIITPDNVEDDEIRREVEAFADEQRTWIEDYGMIDYLPGEGQAFVENYATLEFGDDSVRDPDLEVLKWDHSTATYWLKMGNYPMHFSLSASAEAQFLTAMTFGANVAIYEKDLRFRYDGKQIAAVMSLYRKLKRCSNSINPPLNMLVSRTMFDLTNTPDRTRLPRWAWCERKHARDLVWTWQTEALDYMLMFILLGAHRMYFGRLRKVRDGRSIFLNDFRELMRKFVAEWTAEADRTRPTPTDSNLLATVFVGGNIAFLSVPNINNLQRTASLASTIFALLSVATGVRHVWHHRGKERVDNLEAIKYITYARTVADDIRLSDDPSLPQPDADLLLMATFLAVPFSALLWSILAFAAALAALALQGAAPRALPLLALVLAAFVVVGAATLLFFRGMWKGRRESPIAALLRGRCATWSASLRVCGAPWKGRFSWRARERSKKLTEERANSA